MQLTLLSRSYCHLCDDMLAALEPFRRRFAFTVDVIDIDQHPSLEERYGDLVPVLLRGEAEKGQEICHYFLDEEKLAAVFTV